MRLGGKGLHQDKNSCRFGRAKRVVDTAGSADRDPPPPAPPWPDNCLRLSLLSTLGGEIEGKGGDAAWSPGWKKLGGGRSGTPAPGPPRAPTRQVCARAGGAAEPARIPFRVLREKHGQGTAGRPRSSGVPFGTTLAGNLGTGRDRAPGTPELPFRGSPREKPKRGGRQGALDPPGFHSGSPSGKLKRREDPPEPLGFCSGSLQRETRARRRRVPSGSPGLPFGVLPAKKHGEAPGSRRRRSRRPGSGGIPGCGPAA